MPRLDRILIVGAGLMAAAPPLWASTPEKSANPTDKLQTIEQTAAHSRAQRESLARAAAALASEIDGLRRQSITAAEAMQRHEAALTMLEAQLKSLADEEKRKTSELERDEEQRAGLLMALVQLARKPPEALALATPDPVTAERGALVMGATVPPLDAAARRLRGNLRQLAALREAIGRAEARHRDEQGTLNSQQAQLADLIARKSALERQAKTGTEETDEKLVALAAEAANLKDLIDKLDAEKQEREAAALAAVARAPTPVAATLRPPAPSPARPAPSPTKPAPTAIRPAPAPTPIDPRRLAAAPAVAPAAIAPLKPPKIKSFLYAPGNYLVPASGKMIRGYDKPNEVGLANKGLTYETRSAARVIAPYDGRVLFSGPFRGYGQILIIEHADGYHSLIAGLAKLDVTVGQWLIAGEPVGVMPEGEDKPRLYLELRHDGQPINPLPWLATSNEKASG